MKGRFAILGALLGVLASLTPSLAAHGPTMYRQTYIMTRTVPLSAPTHFNLGASWGNSFTHSVTGFVGLVGVQVRHGALSNTGMFSLFGTFGTEDSASVHVSGHTVRPCPDYGECLTEQSTFAVTYDAVAQDQGASTDSNRVYIVFEATQPASVTFSAHGWSLHKTSFSYRWLDSNQTDATQLRAHGYGAEIFTNGQLSGGKYGSIATVTPPCSTETEVTVPQGAGQLTLSAPGAKDATATCPTAPWNAVSVIRHTTTWSAHGDAAGGNGDNTARMFVIDLPKKL
jgi:hypothetical protein